MATTKRRLNITLEPDVDALVRAIARRDRVPQARKVSDLLRTSLALEEDRALGLLAEKRLSESGKVLSHKAVWK